MRGAINFASSALEKVKGGIGGVASFFGIGDGSESPQGVGEGVAAANQQIGMASAAPTNNITSNAISNSATKMSENNIQTGDIIVQTQATDAQGISKDIGSELQGQLKGLEMESATGVDR